MIHLSTEGWELLPPCQPINLRHVDSSQVNTLYFDG